MRRTGLPVIKNILEADTEHRTVGWGQLKSGRPVTPLLPRSMKWAMVISPKYGVGSKRGGWGALNPQFCIECIEYKIFLEAALRH